MANTRDIRIRIKGVKNTRQITRAMQMVATSKMKKAQESAKAGRPYALLLADMIVSIADEFEELTQSYFIQRPVKHRGILVIGTDKGLCGALNSNLFRVLSDVEDSAKFISLGKRASQYRPLQGFRMCRWACHPGGWKRRAIPEMVHFRRRGGTCRGSPV